MLYYRPSTKLWEGNVFSRVSPPVILSTGRGPVWSLPIIHYTSLYRDLSPQPQPQPWPSPWTWDITIEGPPSPTPLGHGTSLHRVQHASSIWLPKLESFLNMFYWEPPLALTSHGQTRNLFKLVHLRSPQWFWHLVAIEVCTLSTSGWYTPHWNALL